MEHKSDKYRSNFRLMPARSGLTVIDQTALVTQDLSLSALNQHCSVSVAQIRLTMSVKDLSISVGGPLLILVKVNVYDQRIDQQPIKIKTLSFIDPQSSRRNALCTNIDTRSGHAVSRKPINININICSIKLKSDGKTTEM